MLIGVDIDGVLFPWDECARDALVAKFGIERPGESTSWFYLKETIAVEHWAWLWSTEGQNDVFGRVGRVYPGAVAAINAILKPGDHDVHFVTHRDPRRTAVHTAAFLHLHFGGHPWAGVHVIQASVAKRTLARWDVFIDDKPDTVWDFLGNTNAKVFSPVRPWNGELNESYLWHLVNDGERLVHYDDPQEIADWVLR